MGIGSSLGCSGGKPAISAQTKEFDFLKKKTHVFFIFPVVAMFGEFFLVQPIFERDENEHLICVHQFIHVQHTSP